MKVHPPSRKATVDKKGGPKCKPWGQVLPSYLFQEAGPDPELCTQSEMAAYLAISKIVNKTT
jgi:hypothetical protein